MTPNDTTPLYEVGHTYRRRDGVQRTIGEIVHARHFALQDTEHGKYMLNGRFFDDGGESERDLLPGCLCHPAGAADGICLSCQCAYHKGCRDLDGCKCPNVVEQPTPSAAPRRFVNLYVDSANHERAGSFVHDSLITAKRAAQGGHPSEDFRTYELCDPAEGAGLRAEVARLEGELHLERWGNVSPVPSEASAFVTPGGECCHPDPKGPAGAFHTHRVGTPCPVASEATKEQDMNGLLIQQLVNALRAAQFQVNDAVSVLHMAAAGPECWHCIVSANSVAALAEAAKAGFVPNGPVASGATRCDGCNHPKHAGRCGVWAPTDALFTCGCEQPSPRPSRSAVREALERIAFCSNGPLRTDAVDIVTVAICGTEE